MFRLAEPVTVSPGSQIIFTLRHDSPHISHNLGRFRLSVTGGDNPVLGDGSQSPLLAALRKPPAQRTAAEVEVVIAAYPQPDDKYRALAKEKQQSEEQRKSVMDRIARVMVMQDQEQPRKTFVLERGLYNQQRQEVTAGVPVALPQLPANTPADRLGLARWLMAADQPLTARVTVNRLWQQFFGVGLVKTTENFGVQGEVPVHLELLDFLAADFRDSGWDVKALLRQIVTSRTYRQSSRVTAELVEHDPDNRLLARGPRFRMPSWMLRDQALAASGLLVTKLGGPPVNGYQPAGVWEEATFGGKGYRQDHGEALYRRSLYIFWRRILGPTVLFDNAARQTCTVKTLRTNTPLHALLTLNDVTYVEAARALAQRVLTGADAEDHAAAETAGGAGSGSIDDAARLDRAFQRVLSRDASAAERAILLAGLTRSRRQFQSAPADAQKLLAVGESPRDASLDPVEHASWTALCLAILNLDETLTKE